MTIIVAFSAGLAVGLAVGAYGWYRWGTTLKADATKIRSAV